MYVAITSRRFTRTTRELFIGLFGLAVLVVMGRPVAAQTAALQSLPGHIPPAVARADAVGQVDAERTLSLALTLPLRNQTQLADLLSRLYDPDAPEYGQFLTPEQFAERFAPTKQDYDRAIAYAEAMGLTVTGTHPNRTLLNVEAPAEQVERAFGRRLLVFRSRENGRFFYAPEAEPLVPAGMAAVVSGVVGLDNAARWRPHSQRRTDGAETDGAENVTGARESGRESLALPRAIGSGPGGGLSPKDIKAAYGLSGVSLGGGGQTLAVFELDGYKASDVTAYETFFALPKVPLQNILVDGFSGAAGSGAGEVTLDIELQAALAPGASKILVYEGPNSGTGVIDTYNRIATDNLAKQISTSWGIAENSSSATIRNAENAAFQQMAAQGQSIYAASGDSGAFDNGSTLSVDDPASQPFMVGVGGTRLTTNGPGGTYVSEKTWNGGSINAGGGGGGISTIWPIPSYQVGVLSTASKGSTTKRNVPDVSLNADPNTGYAIFFGGRWVIFGGTSCASPLWAGFTALVNQQRAISGKAPLGFANPALYAIGKSASAATNFHDIADGSTNLFYPAVAKFDDATGWGSFNGVNLIPSLASATGTGGGGSGGGTGGGGSTATQLLKNPGFENGAANPSPWSVTAGVVDNSASEPAHAGLFKAWLDGYGTTHTDTTAQTVAIPSTVTSATLTFFLHIDTAETTTTLAKDTLQVQVRNGSGTVLATLATFSNLNRTSGYVQKSFNLSGFKGQTVQIFLIGKEDASLGTSFVVDDFALNVQ